MRKRTLAAVLLTLAGARPAAAQVPLVAEGPVQVALTGRLQSQFNTSTEDSVYSTFEQRRMRLGVMLTVDEWIEGRLEANFAHGFRLEDAYVNLGFDPRLEVQVGQFKKPFSRLELVSSARIVPIEYGLRIRGFDMTAEHYLLLEQDVYLGREIGAQVHGQLGMLGYAAGVFNGSDQNNRDFNDAKSFAGRLNLKPFDAPLEIGAGASFRDLLVTDTADLTSTEDGLAIEVDAQWGAFRTAGPMLMVEIMKAESFRTGDPMIGGQAVVSWFLPLGDGSSRFEGLEPLARASYGDPSTDIENDGGLLLTPGVNLYFHGRNRLMLNWDYYMSELDSVDPASAIRAQLQLYF